MSNIGLGHYFLFALDIVSILVVAVVVYNTCVFCYTEEYLKYYCARSIQMPTCFNNSTQPLTIDCISIVSMIDKKANVYG